MAYIGSTPTSQSFTSGTDYFSGNGSTTAYTLSRQVSSINDVIVVIENVVQKPLDAYTIVGTTLTFTSAPPSGTNNIYVRYMSTSTVAIQPNDLSVTTNKIADNTVTTEKLHTAVLQPANISDKANTSTGYLDLPAGTTAQRPAIPASGMTRFNTTTGKPEWWDSIDNVWRDFSSIGGGYDYAIEVLLVAGGGGADNDHGGGGGAGGVLFVTPIVVSGTSYSITVGAGGAGDPTAPGAANGTNSIFNNDESSTAYGGGGAGNGNLASGNPGGSGGGGGGNTATFRTRGGSGVLGQGNGGGNGGYQALGEPGGGGGGAGAPGGDAIYNTNNSTSWAGNGGSGTYRYSAWASATSTGADGGYFAGGGGGGCTNGSGGLGGLGGGGAGTTTTTGNNGNANTGGGGGSCGNGGTGGNGASGIVILRYAGAQRGTGGTIASSNGWTYHTFTSSGTYTA